MNSKMSRRPNNVLVESRTGLKMSHEKLAYLVRQKANERGIQIGSLDSVTRHIKRIEAGQVREPSKVYKSLLCAIFHKSEAALFGTASPDHLSGDFRGQRVVNKLKLRNHKLIPAFIGADAARRAVSDLAMRPVLNPIRHYRCQLTHPRSVECALWVWPFGVAMFHLSEVVESSNLADFAVWHRRVYDEQMTWANQTFSRLLKANTAAQYAMPVNWVMRSIWDKSRLGTALRILTAPRILLPRIAGKDTSDLAHAELVERALLDRGIDQFDASRFGVEGISEGIASWSGVVYFPLVPERALSESDILGFERTVQAAWSYCDWIRTRVESGNDPDVSVEYGHRQLRALRSIITNPRPEESSQVYPLRVAVLQTSRITEHLNQAIDVVRE